MSECGQVLQKDKLWDRGREYKNYVDASLHRVSVLEVGLWKFEILLMLSEVR